MTNPSDSRKPWHGVLVATSLPFTDDLEPDLDAFGANVAWLAEQGLHGVAPNGSLGEYQTLTEQERDAVVTTAVAIASAGLPVTAYNNPIDTKVDLRPELLAKLYDEGFVVGVKEFSGDVRRCYEISELAPSLDLMIGTDDTILEVGLAGAKGWVAGYPQVFPKACLDLYEASLSGDLERALPLYRQLHSVLRWDSKTEFIQAIKLGQDLIGRPGGRCRPPRQPLTPEQDRIVRTLTQALIDAGVK